MWPFRKREDQLLELVSKVLQQNAETQRAFLEVTNRISETAKQQGEVLARYLDLFKTPSEPRRWTAQQNDAQEMKKILEAEGYPFGGDEKEQAEWLAENL